MNIRVHVNSSMGGSRDTAKSLNERVKSMVIPYIVKNTLLIQKSTNAEEEIIVRLIFICPGRVAQ